MQKAGTVTNYDGLARKGSIFCKGLGGTVKFQFLSVRDGHELEPGDIVHFELGHVDGVGQAVRVVLVAKGTPQSHAQDAQTKAPRAASFTHSEGHASERHDDKEQCQSCSKFMVPRLVISQGIPERSFCPFCGDVHKDFRVVEKPGILQTVGEGMAGAALGSLIGSFISF